jgi:hypothetical protein
MAQKTAWGTEQPRTITRPPSVNSQQSLNLPSSPGIAVESLDGSFGFYRTWEARVERIQPKEVEWTELTPQDILQHLVLRTCRWKAASC